MLVLSNRVLFKRIDKDNYYFSKYQLIEYHGKLAILFYI